MELHLNRHILNRHVLNRQVRSATLGALVLAGSIAGFGLAAQAQGARVGALECTVSGGTGFVITSSKALNCDFTPAGGRSEHYFGTINRYGLDIGITGPGKLEWVVLAPGSYPGPGSLQGSYTGVGGGATVGAGATANVLVGGNGGSLSLQPLSVSGQIGLNITAGIGQITLDYVPMPTDEKPRKKKKKQAS